MLRVDIEKRFPGFTLKADFAAEDGVLALLGASGCGKSMTLKCIAGIIRPDSGSIVRDGEVLFDKAKGIDLAPQKRKVGLLFQNYALFPNMTVRKNIETGLLALKDRAARKRRCDELMAAFRIEELSCKYPYQLSGGQQQRAALCRILASEPKTLLLDEPFSALDSYLKWQMERELFDTLGGFMGCTVYVSHDRDEVYALCDSVCAMDRGATQPVRKTAEFFKNPETLSAALLSGCKNISRAKMLGPSRVAALDWGVEFCTAAPVPEDTSYIGIRAHDLCLCGEGEENAFPVRLERVVPDMFSTVLQLSPLSGGSLRLETKNTAPIPQLGERMYISAHPQDIMLLK